MSRRKYKETTRHFLHLRAYLDMSVFWYSSDSIISRKVVIVLSLLVMFSLFDSLFEVVVSQNPFFLDRRVCCRPGMRHWDPLAAVRSHAPIQPEPKPWSIFLKEQNAASNQVHILLPAETFLTAMDCYGDIELIIEER